MILIMLLFLMKLYPKLKSNYNELRGSNNKNMIILLRFKAVLR
jgi:hypothetical protein